MQTRANDESQKALRRMLGNFGWLLGGKGFGAVSSLIYLAILSRSLGVKDFGHFALIFGLSQAFVLLAGFQTWQVIVKLGTPHLMRGDRAAFARLSMLGGAVDLAASLAGCVMVTSIMLVFGEALELNPAYDKMALAFICAMLLTRVSAPFGIIRALDRFELSVWVGAITPSGRLLAAIAIWLTGPSVGRFLFAWALVELLTAPARPAPDCGRKRRHKRLSMGNLLEHRTTCRGAARSAAGSGVSVRHQRGRDLPDRGSIGQGARQVCPAGFRCCLSRGEPPAPCLGGG
jgi:O-antigen/teichoic acid export membrane protein